MIKIALSEISRFQKSIDKTSAFHEKCLKNAVQGAGFKLRTKFKEEIKQESPGGSPFKERTEISKYISGRKKTLSNLEKSIFYEVFQDNPYRFEFGWVGRRSSRLSKGLAIANQEGFNRPVTDHMRKSLAAIGSKLVKSENRKYFFLRKSTKVFKTPQRQMIDPFWQAHRLEAYAMIKKFYEIKIKGGRF